MCSLIRNALATISPARSSASTSTLFNCSSVSFSSLIVFSKECNKVVVDSTSVVVAEQSADKADTDKSK